MKKKKTTRMSVHHVYAAAHERSYWSHRQIPHELPEWEPAVPGSPGPDQEAKISSDGVSCFMLLLSITVSLPPRVVMRSEVKG